MNVPIVSKAHPDPATASQLLVARTETLDSHLAVFRKAKPHLPGRPASEVSWSEARAFCNWLTTLERANGTIQPTQRYRLPTDHEWSCAVGIGQWEDATSSPQSKNNRLPDRYPWGSQWPPPPGAGNLCGAESRSVSPENYIAGYHDRNSSNRLRSPASKPNALGLYDLSGNLWEWCEDSFQGGTTDRVLRGGSWKSARQETLLSSHRTFDPENYRSDSVGFRCVLGDEK
ncbi:MAG: SUMF1/EgtB/PvdO family nonheme iron enzyme [Verrucomicrobiaceae bacterium]|nr:SUMF1/EgtB/PvdO family nonheme iron enzyme [Verrucomicrobiaceae bacterium]